MDQVDTSEWLTDEQALAYAVNGRDKRILYNPDGRYQSCEPALLTALDWMAEEGLLTSEQVYTCRRFMACRLRFEGRCGAKTMRFDAVPGESDGPNMADDYTRVLRQVSKDDCETAVWIHETPCPRGMQHVLRRNKDHISEVLGRIQKAFESDGENSACA